MREAAALRRERRSLVGLDGRLPMPGASPARSSPKRFPAIGNLSFVAPWAKSDRQPVLRSRKAKKDLPRLPERRKKRSRPSETGGSPCLAWPEAITGSNPRLSHPGYQAAGQ